MMKRCLLAAALLAVAIPAAAEWTIHTGSVHFGSGSDEMNNLNPGIGYQFRNNVRVGALYNSYKYASAYAAYVYDVRDNVHLGFGAITGYKWDSDQKDLVGDSTGVVPLFAVEVDLSDSLSLLWFGQAINLEYKF
jgi:hypothetical protein